MRLLCFSECFTMKTAGFCVLLLGVFSLCNAQQRVAPGVPPQQYQQVPQQQYQQVHNQVPQQVPLQQQHVPQQQHIPQQQHVQHAQPGHGQAHGHAQGHHGNPQILNAANIAQEKQHIQEHMEVPIDTSKMTDQELQFHYFKMHDADNNNKLDGCELIKSLIHWHEQGHKEPAAQHAHPPPQEKIFKDDELVALIDPIMNMDDADGDGFIDYPEFVRAQNKAAAAGANAPRS
ncbi:multiple coagulation factor deficiency protein 2 homolog isoform X6 [Frankliniella occidentalis]|uniref:Multiple coagulation factor deficiency protein 2 homolog isoform X6 n=1 Tax=Frankliniella occidentalis TaxID=133901 RepID=A0A9C6XDA1_FRAOC|nr:multiple coagulation factor deficiency protein 2 homolog isoform X6 [Frankliniella occidentalis]